MIAIPDSISLESVAETVRLAVAPIFLLSGIGAFLNVCASRLSRIVDRSRDIEPLLLASRGGEHDRWLIELQTLDRRMSLVSLAVTFAVLSAGLTCLVVILLFAGEFIAARVGVAVALLFIGAMVSIAFSFAIFLIETRIGARSVRVRSELLQHRVDDQE